MTLVLEDAVAQFAETVDEDGAGERVTGLALVEDAAGAAPLLGIIEPVEHEQDALDPPDLEQRADDGVLAGKSCQLAHHDRLGRDLRLVQAAMGQPETKVAELCVELGITRQTLYRHVTPKGEIRADGEKLLARGRR